MPHVLVTGARGKTGAPAVAQLSALPGVTVAAGGTQPAALRAPGAQPVRFDWDDAATFATAADGADAVFVVRPDLPDAPQRVAQLVAAAPGTRIVLLSELVDGLPDGHWAYEVEAAVSGAAERWTVLRPSWFMQVFTDPRFYRDDVRAGSVPFVVGEPVSWVDARDIAAVAVAALLDDAHAGATIPVTGPEALAPADALAVLGTAAGHPVALEARTIHELTAGMGPFDATNTEGSLRRIADGDFATVTGDVEAVTGRPARTLAAFAAEHAGEWRTP